MKPFIIALFALLVPADGGLKAFIDQKEGAGAMPPNSAWPLWVGLMKISFVFGRPKK
jgi:hypothetical protein